MVIISFIMKIIFIKKKKEYNGFDSQKKKMHKIRMLYASY